MLALMATATKPVSAQPGSYQVFYDDLSPYGYWVNDANYGYVWVPDVQGDFAPYHTNGYWTLTDYGWTWVSNYSWGWAPFHYGRWNYDPYYGYMWVPGHEWGPGWVVWGNSGGYYGWAPIGPGISANVAYGGHYNPHHQHWNYVPHNHFGGHNINNYYVDNSTNVTIYNTTTIINNPRKSKDGKLQFNAGPNQHEVEKHSGQKLQAKVLRDEAKPGQQVGKNEMKLYRPKIAPSATVGEKARPSKLTEKKDLRPRGNMPDKDSDDKGNKALPDKQRAPDRKQNVPHKEDEEKQPLPEPKKDQQPEHRKDQQPLDHQSIEPHHSDSVMVPKPKNRKQEKAPRPTPGSKRPR